MKKIVYILTAAAFFFFSILPVPGFAFNVKLVRGNATVTTNGDTVTIDATGRVILKGNASIPVGDTVDVIGGGTVLLRDTTGKITSILGSLLSNGNIILINTMGVYFGKSANVNVGSLIASTLNISNKNFLSGNYQFEKVPGLNPATILNEANIKIANGGYIVLLADQVVNKGTITAYMGTVAFGSGQQATVSFDEGGLINLVINQGLAQQLTGKNGNSKSQIINTGSIIANGGKVVMTAQLLETTLKEIVNNTGIIEADNVVEHGGLVELTSSGAINNSGTIQAGSVKEQGETFKSTGTLDIGQGNFSNLDQAINISGNISGTYSDVANIDLTGAVTLTGDTALTADSGDTGTQGTIVMNGNSVTGGGFNLTMTAGLNDTLDGNITGVNLLTLNSSTANNVTFTSTGTTFSVTTLQTNYHSLFSRSQGAGTSGNPYMIYSDSNAIGGLQYIPTESLSAYYQLANNVNAAETSSWNSGAGFTPIGNSAAKFTGNFNGNGNAISNLFIYLPTTNDVGLFGYTNNATIANIGLLNVNVTGEIDVGGLAGYEHSGSIDNSYASGTVNGTSTVGGLVGEDLNGSIADSYAGGVVGNSGFYVDNIGGLVGESFGGSVTNSYSTTSVVGYENVGGLVGYQISGGIDNSYATGSVNADDNVGGLLGFVEYGGSVSRSYATGSVSGPENVGGLVGFVYNGVTIENSFATGTVIDTFTSFGGLIGDDIEGGSANSYTNNWWFNNLSNGIGSSGLDISVGHWQEAGAATDFFDSSQAVYNGSSPWNISAVTGHTWAISSNDDAYPLLQFPYSTTITNAYQLQLMFLNLSATYNLANNIDASATIDWNASRGFAPIGIVGAPFTGTFNGDGYTISNLFINLFSTNDVGLFGYTNAATIENVGLINDNITGSDEVGGLVGEVSSSSIVNTFATGNISGSIKVGSLVGYNKGLSSIDNSYAAGNVSGTDSVGGLVGYNSSLNSIDNSYSASNVSGSNDVGGLVGDNVISGGIINSYATGNVSGSFEYVGGLVGVTASTNIINSYATGNISGGGTNVGGLLGGSLQSTIDNSYSSGLVSGGAAVGGFLGVDLGGNNYTSDFFNHTVNPSLTGRGSGNVSGITGDTTAQLQTQLTFTNAGWNFNGLWAINSNAYPHLLWQDMGNAASFIGGSSTDPFLVNNVNQLQFMEYGLNDSFELANNIDASATSSWNNGQGFVPIGSVTLDLSFSGTFNGNGHTISNLYIDLPATNGVGLFGYAQESNIENVGMLNENILGGIFVGGLVGENYSSSTISDCYSIGIISAVDELAGNSDVGGLVGLNKDSSIITNSYAVGSVNGAYGDAGGLVGANVVSSLNDSYASENVSGSSNVGGLVGSNQESIISNSYAAGIVSGNSDVGGLVGLNNDSSIITNSYAVSRVNGTGNVGGLVGYNNSGSIDNSYSAGLVTATGTVIGGFVGLDSGGSYSVDFYDHTVNSSLTGTGGGNISGITPETTVAMQTSTTFTGAGWTFPTTWIMTSAQSYPDLIGPMDVWVATGGTGNLWSNPANWSGLVPTASSKVLFNGSDTNSSTIDSSFGETITKLVINTGYTGIITDSAPLTINSDYDQITGTFDQNGNLSIGGNFTQSSGSFTSSPSYAFSVADSFTLGGGMFNRFTGSGTSGSPYMIYDIYGLQAMGDFLSSDFELANNINANLTSGWNAGGGFTPVGNSSTPFTGIFNGEEDTILNLYINLPSTNDLGLFGYTNGATIENIGLVNENIAAGNRWVGGVVGYNLSSSIDNSYAIGSVNGNSDLGGLVGQNDSSSVANSYASVSINVNGGSIGGLVGVNYNSSSITDSYATGWISGISVVGGLVGTNTNSSSVTNSYATGSVSSFGNDAGGLIGANESSSVNNSYATGQVQGVNDVGGLIGYNKGANAVDNSYSSGQVSNTGSALGGFVGDNVSGNYSADFFDNTINANLTGTGSGDVSRITGDSTTLMQNESTFVNAGWDFNSLWAINNGQYPHLLWQDMGNGSFIGGGTSSPFLIRNVNQLQFMEYDLGASYELANNIDASATSGWNSGAGFVPVGNLSAQFTGTFNGENYTISGLFIDLPSTSFAGLFGEISGATIENVGIANANIHASGVAGGLAGTAVASSSIINSYTTGTISVTNNVVGGLVAEILGSSNIINSYSNANVNGGGIDNGGLVGIATSSTVTNSYATGSVTGIINTGGLVGLSNSGIITNSYANGTVNSSGGNVGGLVGDNADGSIVNSYATGTVNSTDNGFAGGLAGYNINGAKIDNSYALGNVNGNNNYAGGLVGYNLSASIDNSYYAGVVSGSSTRGGLVGLNGTGNSYSSNFYDHSLNPSLSGTGNGDVSGISGVSTGLMQSESTFTNAGWDFNGLWSINSNAYPYLVWQGMSNGNFIGGTAASPFLIHNINQLQFMEYDLSGSFELANNIDASATSSWNSDAGFTPIGNGSTKFTGIFNGDGYTISNLDIALPATHDVGLFGYTNGATIKNIGLLNVNITGEEDVGGLVGYNSNSSSIDNSYATGRVNGSEVTGGLVGENFSSSIINSYAAGSVSGGDHVGGLVGYNSNSSSITNSYATASVSGTSFLVGGLVGANQSFSTIANSYATGNVRSTSYNVGGLAGTLGDSSSIYNSYATGNVSGANDVGGIVGSDYLSNIDNSYSVGLVSGTGSNIGGFVGSNSSSTYTSDFFDHTINSTLTGTGSGNVSGITGDSTTVMKTESTFTNAGWDFSNIWEFTGNSYPILRSNTELISPSNPSSPTPGVPLSTQQRDEILGATVPENTASGFYQPLNLMMEGPSVINSSLMPDEYWIPSGENWMNIDDESANSKYILEAGHAVQRPWGVELLPYSNMKLMVN